MPNHCTHRVVITGDEAQLADFRKSCFNKDSDGTEFLDFETITPMPADLHIESGSVGDIGYAAFHGGDIAHILSYPWVNAHDRESLCEFLDRQDQRYREVGAIYAQNKALHGHTNWYDWALANWGTKWNSYSLSWVSELPGVLHFLFDTAWSPPEPIFQSLAERYPGLVFDVKCFDEGWCFAGSGQFNGDDDFEIFGANDHYYELVYGHSPQDDSEECEEAMEED